jgi:hypothetical protein
MDTAIPSSAAWTARRSGRFEARNRSACWGLWARKYWMAPVPGAGLRTSLASLSGRWNKALPLWLLRNSFWNWFWFWFWFRRLPAT